MKPAGPVRSEKSLPVPSMARIFLNHIQSINNETTCSKLCHLSDCQTISEYFKDKYPLENQSNQSFNQPLSAVEIISDPVDDDLFELLMNQTSDQERNETQR